MSGSGLASSTATISNAAACALPQHAVDAAAGLREALVDRNDDVDHESAFGRVARAVAGAKPPNPSRPQHACTLARSALPLSRREHQPTRGAAPPAARHASGARAARLARARRVRRRTPGSAAAPPYLHQPR